MNKIKLNELKFNIAAGILISMVVLLFFMAIVFILRSVGIIGDATTISRDVFSFLVTTGLMLLFIKAAKYWFTKYTY